TVAAADTAHSGSPGTSNTVNVTLRTTTTAVSCTPNAIVVSQATTCTGFVKDTALAGTPSAPGGTIAFTNGGTATGSFTGTPCNLTTVNATTSSCNVTFTPTNSGTVIASGTYSPTDTAHSGSGPTAGNIVNVAKRTTSTVVTCSPATVSTGQTVTCIAFVKDTSTAGTTSTPAGTVAFTNTGSGTGTFSGTPCNLTTVNATTSSCQATIAPSTTGTVIASAIYTVQAADTAHSGIR